VRFRRGALQVATLSAILYLALVISQYIEPTAFFPRSWQTLAASQLPSQRFAQYTVAINLFGFFAVALLSGSLAENLRSAGASLERASNQIADLRAFNQYVIDSMLSGLVTADMDGRVLTFNRAAATIAGLSAGQAVGEMAAGIAHEIRNPLASMSGSIQVLRQELPLSEEQAQLMDIVLRESERLNDTIKSFLAYARPQRFTLTRLDVRKVVQDTAT